jgi:hypothetical protein
MNIKNAKLIIEEVAFACSNWLEFANEVQVDEELKFTIQATHLKL